MVNLISTIKNTIESAEQEHIDLPFSVYSSVKEQKLLNVPIVKPLLILVLSGKKALGKQNELACQAGDFIFLSANPALDMRNIPKDNEYFALLIDFEEQDYKGLQKVSDKKHHYCVGKSTLTLERCLQQFVESSLWAPKALWSSRKREIITLLCHMGYHEVLSLIDKPTLVRQLHDLFIEKSLQCNQESPLTIGNICIDLAMSESTLRRKLKTQGTSVQQIKDQARLGLGLHLLQTSHYSIGLIAQKCGYLSQSRFSDRFKKLFGLTPSELRKTKMMG